jgi:hypothetical protein
MFVFNASALQFVGIFGLCQSLKVSGIIFWVGGSLEQHSLY